MSGHQRLHAQGLEGKVAIVTESARGLGAEMVIDLARRGARVIVTWTSTSPEAKAAKLVDDITALPNGSAAIRVRANLGDPSAPKDIIDATLNAFGKGHPHPR